MTPFNHSTRKRLNRSSKLLSAGLRWFPLLFLSVLCGCSGTALRHAYTDYTEVYAQAVNRQLLLNLARLSHDQPPYFIQLGQISSQFSFNSSIGFSPSAFRVSNPGDAIQNGLTLGGSLSAGAVETPTFQFVPLNGEAFAQAIISPISDRLFYTLYDQGFHADLLLRTMIASVEVPDWRSTNFEQRLIYRNHPRDPTYPDFLAFCKALRKAQLEGAVVVVNNTNVTSEPTVYRDVKLGETIGAMAAGMTVTNAADKSNFIVTGSRKGFTLASVVQNHTTNLFSAPGKGTFRIQDVRLKPRTFIGVMYAVAREEVYFEQLVRAGPNAVSPDISFKRDPSGAQAFVAPSRFSEEYFEGQPRQPVAVRPILTLTGYNSSQRARLTKTVEVNFNGQTYTVGDFENATDRDALGDLPPSNGRVFSLVSYLFAQLAIDPQKLPVQQLIQVR